MDLKALRKSPVGQLVPIGGTDGRTGKPYAHSAFLPNALPDAITLTSATWTAVAAATAALGRLDEAARQVPEPALLRRPSLRREAQSTSALEGTFAPLRDVLEGEAVGGGARSAEVQEILNYVAAAEEAFAWVAERPLTRGALEHLQRLLIAGTPGERPDTGRLREIQVFIGAREGSITDARFVPPPPGDQLHAGVEDWIRWTASPPPTIPPVVQAALAHYQFETLHPFSDGNGRLGRLVIVLQFLRQGLLGEPILVVSPWFEERRSAYQDHLLRVSQTGDWDTWVTFFATGVQASADETRRRIDELQGWRTNAVNAVRSGGGSGVAERVAAEIIGGPVLAARDVAARHGVSHQGAMNALRRLVDLGLLEETRRGGRVLFIAPDVIRLLSS